jgi:hypothetical protein
MKVLIEFIISFVIAFIVTGIVSLVYSLAVHGKGVIDWGSSVRFAIIAGIIMTWINTRARRKKER